MYLKIILLACGLLLTNTVIATSQDVATPIINGYTHSLQSKTLNQQRRYMVSLPENYHESSQAYATLYVIDSDFQFQHVAMVANNMARMGKIPPMIVVGIANQGNADYVLQNTWSVDGEKDFGGAANYYRYIKDELVPLIDKKYRSNGNRIMSGYSLGGLFTTYTMCQDDTPFNAFLAMSPSYWVDNYSATKSIAKCIKDYQGQRPPLFLSVANEEGMGVTKLRDNLKALALKDWHWQFKHYPQENHFSTALPAMHDALSFLFDGFYQDIYQLKQHKDYQAAIASFKQREQDYNGFRIEWLQGYKFAHYVFGTKQTDQISHILALVEKEMPDSLVMITNYLAKGLNSTKKPQQAKDILDAVKHKGGDKIALWHHQYSKALVGLNQPQQAAKHQAQAMRLAKKYKLPMWQIWEMK